METINLKFKSKKELETLSKLLTYIHENFEDQTKRRTKLAFLEWKYLNNYPIYLILLALFVGLIILNYFSDITQ